MTKKHILVVDDEKEITDLIEIYLTTENYRVTKRYDASTIEQDIEGVDLVILDIMMPIMDGITALKQIRKSGDKTYVLMLTAKAEIDDRVTGLDSGADDYLTKPFSLKELLARLRSKERRDDKYTPNEVEVGDLALNVAEQELVSHNSIRLGSKETQLLNYLMLNEGKEFSTSDLLAHVWKDDEDANEDIVWIYISYLRQKLQSIQSTAQIVGEKGGSFSLIR